MGSYLRRVRSPISLLTQNIHLDMSTLDRILNPSINSVPRRLYCYRYYAWATDYDEEIIWTLVQSWGGHISIRGDCIDYWVPTDRAAFFVLKYPDLVRQPALEYL